jgi:hypothetical protein
VGIGQFPEPDAKALQKYLYAIATQPISAIAPEQLLERPQNTTENPYFHLFLESRESQLFAGRTEEVDETEEQIFGTSDPTISAEEAAKINAMTEAASLHVRGFDL